MRSSTRCCCATSRTRRGAARSAALAAGSAAESIAASGGEAPFTHGPVRRQRDVRRPAAGTVPRRRPAAARLRQPADRAAAGGRGAGALRRDAAAQAARRRRRAAAERGAVHRPAGATACSARTCEFSGGRVRARGGQWIKRGPERCRALHAHGSGVPGARTAQRPGAARGLLPRPAQLLRRAAGAARERARAVLACAAWATSISCTASDQELRVLQRRARALHQHGDDGDAAGSCGLGRARERPGGERRGWPVQLRRDGARAAGRALDPVRARHAHPPRAHHLQHRVELRSRDHPAAPARHRHHRIRHRGPARRHGRGSDRRAAERRRLALPGAAAGARPGGRQDRARITRSRKLTATIFRNAWPARSRLTGRGDSSASIRSAPTSPTRRSRWRAP